MTESLEPQSKEHPENILFQEELSFPSIPSCEHYCGSEKFVKKAYSLQHELGPIFDITCDCEDGAATGHEQDHAIMMADLINHADNKFKRSGARIHAPSTKNCKDDIDTLIGISGINLAYLTIPKIDSYDTANRTIDYIQNRCVAAGIDPIPIHLIIETQNGLAELEKLAVFKCLETIDFGLLDFISDHRGIVSEEFMQSPGQFSHHLINQAKTKLCSVAIRHGIIPTHNPSINFRDLGGCAEDAKMARLNYGFMRMYSIHPKQIPFIVEAMQPSKREVKKATEILIKAKNNSWGPISYGDAMHDRASYRLYWNILKRARQTGANVPIEAQNEFFRNEPLIDWQAIKQFRR